MIEFGDLKGKSKYDTMSCRSRTVGWIFGLVVGAHGPEARGVMGRSAQVDGAGRGSVVERLLANNQGEGHGFESRRSKTATPGVDSLPLVGRES